MRNLRSSALCAGFALAATMSLSSAANAAAFVNGGFEAQGNPGATCVSPPITGWTGGYVRCGAGYYNATPPEGSVFALTGRRFGRRLGRRLSLSGAAASWTCKRGVHL